MITETQMSVRFKDIDKMGHVNNAVFLSYFEEARMDYFNKVLKTSWNWVERGILLARNEVDYLHPIYLNNEIVVRTFCTAIGNKSVQLAYEIFTREGESQIKCARGASVLVCYDYLKKATASVPEEWRESLVILEKPF